MTQAAHGERSKTIVVLSSEDEEAAATAVTPTKSKRERVAPARRTARCDDHSFATHNLQSRGAKAIAAPVGIRGVPAADGEQRLSRRALSKRTIPDTATTFASHALKTSVDTSPESTTPVPAACGVVDVPKKAVGKHEAKTKGTRTIFSFFNAATIKQQRDSRRTKSDSPEKSVAEKENELEDIEDDSAVEHVDVDAENQIARSASRKRTWQMTELGSQGDVLHSATATKKYLKSTSDARIAQPQVPLDSRPWSERYGPTTLDEIVVHKKKVADVRQCIERILKRQGRQKMLVLKGPAGSGKTTTVSLLAKALDAELIEWRNTGGGDFFAKSKEYVSMSDRFDDFLGRSRIFGGLSLDSIRIRVAPTTNPQGRGRQIVLVEEFPLQFTTSSTRGLSTFRETILQYLSAGATATSSSVRESALVMIISESVFAASSDADNYTAHRLLGAEILQHPSVTVLEFNPVAPTFISKAFNQVLTMHGRLHGKMSTPTADVLRQLTESGDVRNAISTLEFLCLHSVPSITASTAALSKKKQVKPSNSKLALDTSAESVRGASSELVSSRESTLGLFHAIGKIIYNKRATSASSPHPPLPPHLAHLERPLLPPVTEPMALLSTSGTDASTFLSAVHENLPLSTPCLDTLLACLAALSDADAFMPSRFASAGRSGTEVLRQEDIAFDAGIAGVLLHLPHPVVRSKGAHKLTYPAGLRTWHMREVTLQRLDLLVARQAAGTLGANAIAGAAKSGKGGVGNESGPLAPRRQEMLLERLPYVAHVLTARLPHASPVAQALLREVQLIVGQTGSVAGIGVAGVALEEGRNEEEEKSSRAASRKLHDGRMEWQEVALFGARKGDDAEMGLAKLVLSDDDIEDD